MLRILLQFPALNFSRLIRFRKTDGRGRLYAQALPVRRRAAQGSEQSEKIIAIAVELFLFSLLQSLPAGIGCFTLIARLEYRLGDQAAGVDVYAASLKYVVEIDDCPC